MAKQPQTEKSLALRDAGLATKNANFDSNCPVCLKAIRGKAPKCPVSAVKIPSSSRKQNWIHTDCVDITYHQKPDEGLIIQTYLTHIQIRLFDDGDAKDEAPKTPKETPKMPKKDAPKPKPKIAIAPITSGDGDGGSVLAGLVAPHIIGMVEAYIESEISTKMADISMPRNLVLKDMGDCPDFDVGLVHPLFDEALQMARIRQNVLITGGAGSGKTFAMQQIFDTLKSIPAELGGFANPDKVRFELVSCHSEMQPSDIVGAMIPSIGGKAGVQTHIMAQAPKVFRDGGIMVWDEFDSLHGGTAIACNAMLSGEKWVMPDGSVIDKSPDCIIIATCNTLGQGKGRGAYSSREVLDGATLNRFANGIIHWGYDMAFERQLIGDDEITSFFHDLRSKAESAGLEKRIISPRHMLTAKKQKHILGWSMETIRKVSLRDWNEKDLRTVGFEASFIEATLATNGGAA